MRAADVMTRKVVTIGPDASVAEAIELLTDHDVSALPVLADNSQVIGIISEADLMKRLERDGERRNSWWTEFVAPGRLAGDFAKIHGQKVHEIMTTEVVSASEDMPLGELAALLEKKRIKRVPVLRDGKLVGIVSRANLLQALAVQGSQEGANQMADRAIRLDLLERLGEQKWTEFDSRNIIVKDGVVHVWGLVNSPEEQKALMTLAEEVPGVKRVSDETIATY